jgi:hypothetical protein
VFTVEATVPPLSADTHTESDNDTLGRIRRPEEGFLVLFADVFNLRPYVLSP